MYITALDMPPDWLEYTDLYGCRWRQSGDGYLWLYLGPLWQRADSRTAAEIRGVPVPSGGTWRVTSPRHVQQIAGSGGHWLGSTYNISGTGMAAGGSAYFAGSDAVSGAGTLSAASETLVTAPPNVPPDFAEIPLGPDCCRECHLDDTPLYQGNLCRYCWMLNTLPKPVPVSAPAYRKCPQYAVSSWHFIDSWAFIYILYAVMILFILVCR